jgi:uncharacterized protein (TIGR02391 family)
MDLKTFIHAELWDAIYNSYLAENYRAAVLEAMNYLTRAIREKTGLDGDGTQLVNEAFGGDDPRLRLNKLQTRSEKDVQKGFQLITSGLYSAIRNPRAHENTKDTKNDADSMISFIDYIIRQIDLARLPFTIENFLARVLDQDFVESELYTKELVGEIPKNKYLDTLIEIYRNKSKGPIKAIIYVFQEVFPHLNNAEIKEFMKVVSEELDVIQDDQAIVNIFRIVPGQYWHLVKSTAKMRIENKIIASISRAKLEYDNWPGSETKREVLGELAAKIIDQFTLREKLKETIIDRLRIRYTKRNRYIVVNFLEHLPKLFDNPREYKYCAVAISRLIYIEDPELENLVLSFLKTCPDDWLLVMKDTLQGLTDFEKPKYRLRDGTPFLGKQQDSQIYDHLDEEFIARDRDYEADERGEDPYDDDEFSS